MQLRPRKTQAPKRAKRKALPADASVHLDRCNSAMAGGSAAVNQQDKPGALITAKGESKEDKTLSENAAKVGQELIAQGGDRALQQDPADNNDDQDMEDEYNAKSEEKDIKDQFELLWFAGRMQENQQFAATSHEMTRDHGMSAERDEDSACSIKGEEDEMDVDGRAGKAGELDTNTNDAMDIDNASNTVLRAPTKDNVIYKGGSAYKAAPEPAAFQDHSSLVQQDAEEEEEEEEQEELTIKQEATKLNVPLNFLSDAKPSEYTYQCRKCPQQTRSFIALLEHFETDHKLNYKSRAIRKMHLEPNINDPNNYCRACERAFQGDQKYRDHLRNVHYLVLRHVIDRNREILPDMDDPNNYCCSCKRTYADSFLYRLHLRKFHKMDIAYIRAKTVKNPEIQPEWDDPNFHCRSCKYTYPSRYYFHDHCRTIHRMNLPIPAPSDATSDPANPDNYCVTCNKSYTLKYYYRKHLALFHGNKEAFCRSKRLKGQSRGMQPDVDDPNFYCRVCDRKYARKWGYQHHLISVHHIGKPFPKTSMVPEEDDPNYFCRACGRGYGNRNRYRNHLRNVHHMIAKSLRDVSKESGELPDPMDPNFYCRVCKLTKPSVKSYRNHCAYMHREVLGAAPFINPDAEIDVNSPVFYCAKCDRHYANKQRFTKHLNKAHEMGIDDRFVQPDAEIDVDSPTFTCAKCEITFSDKYCFRRHLKTKHKLKILPKYRIIYPRRKIDPESYNYFCAQCDRHSQTRTNFKNHLKKIHNIE